jgi:flagellar motor switch protein FliG
MKREPVSVMSVILPQLDRSLASKVIEVLPPADQKEVVSRMARLQKIDKDVLVRMEEALKEKIRKQGKIITEEVDGSSVLADILKHMTISDEYNIIEDLSDDNPDLAKEIKEKLFSTETVLQLYDQDLQRVLRDFDDHELAILLKGKDDMFRDKIFSNLSERRRMLIGEEMEFLGALKKSDVETSTREFLRYLQTMVDEGKVVVRRENDYYI